MKKNRLENIKFVKIAIFLRVKKRFDHMELLYVVQSFTFKLVKLVLQLHRAKFGLNRWSNFDNMQVLIF